ncbi:helix-turn-helix domain-containing protein [Altericroceibacterium endophyticum]|uniref:Helix-turn-helix domain-containing protein n=1 Tax=Altericroceibacterium endophyticum TaxID=1808508 RepID=A0A6I4T7K7_9SPHN|nr:helix-turn-helix domain-containing protein [Altericroceibacterium endophyticum]MXO66668.1 helix-turn-helix domain-containing protein [Altericroceibacterium endophyticum]
MKPLLINVSEFCRLLGLGKTKTYELISEQRIDTIKVGRRTLITMESVEAFIAQSKVEPE